MGLKEEEERIKQETIGNYLRLAAVHVNKIFGSSEDGDGKG